METWGGYYVPQTDWSSGGDAIVANRPGSVKGAPRSRFGKDWQPAAKTPAAAAEVFFRRSLREILSRTFSMTFGAHITNI